MDEVGGPDSDGPLPVAWDEARELVAMVLLAAASMLLLAPVVRELADDTDYDTWDRLEAMLNGIRPSSGILLLASAVLVCTVPPVDVVPALRRAVVVIAAVAAVLGILQIVLVMTGDSANPDDAGWVRLSRVLATVGPGTLLAGTAAWLARRVVPFPS